MATLAVKLPTYGVPLIPSPRFVTRKCVRCDLEGFIHGGYYFADIRRLYWFHKVCAESPSKINHPSHPQHPLLFGVFDIDGSQCSLCGETQRTGKPKYSCSICDFKVDLDCALRQPPPSDQPTCHDDHPLVLLKKREKESPCEVCKNPINGFLYSCLECDVHFHTKCAHLSKEENHPCHIDHPLKLMASHSLPDDAEKSCTLCCKRQDNMLYHCSICNFTLCIECTKDPPPLLIHHTKTHTHSLILFPKKISCACNFCGKKDGVMPYVCLQCGFMVHGGCIDLPRIININRHDHRISFTPHLGHGYSKCGVCRGSLSPYHGAYACSICKTYAVHSQCATRWDVWDGVDLEGIPDDAEDIAPYKVVGDNLIVHFFHPHHALRLHKTFIDYDEGARCEACIHPLGVDPIYSCEKCHYILHEKCANLPKKKRLVFGTVPYELQKEPKKSDDVFSCRHCRVYSTGCMYYSLRWSHVDVHCALLSEPFSNDGHPHPLYFLDKKGNCNVCHNKIDGFMLSCDVCDYHLGLCCASLPEKIKHSNDKHPLTLCYGEKANGKYWCDICEKELDPSKWFYTCGVTLHLKCVVGDFSRLMPGRCVKLGKIYFEAEYNNHNTRPLCEWCNSRCEVDVILRSYADDEYFCSRLCLLGFLGYKD